VGLIIDFSLFVQIHRRAHWAIENNLHWGLDIGFDKDSNRTHKRHIALNLIKAEKTSKVGIKIKR
jgi:predicted transposase YbfD/YdcC